MFESRGYLLELTHKTPTRLALQELVDVLARYRYTEFFAYSEDPAIYERVDELPPRVDFGRLSAYCQLQGLECVRLDRDGYEAMFLGGDTVSVATEVARSLAGRVEEMREKMAAAEASGLQRGCRRFLVTDFSDGYDWQPLAASLPGIVLGGNFAASGAKAARMDLERELNSVLGVPLGGMLLKLGTLYLRGGARREGASEFFNLLAHDHGYSRHPGLTDFILDEVSGIARGIRVAAERWCERSDWALELVYMASLVECACRRRDEKRLRELRDLHGQVWRLRHRPEGRAESLARLPRF